MDHTIAAEWGRFLQEVDAQRTDNPKTNNNGAGPKSAQARRVDEKQSVLQRLEDALALPPAPDVPLCNDFMARPDAPPAIEPRQAAVDSHSFLKEFARTPTATEESAEWLKMPAAETQLAPAPQLAAASESTLLQSQAQWDSAPQEEHRLALMAPSANEAVVELQTAPIQEEISEPAAPSWTPDKNLEGDMWKSTDHADAAVSTMEPVNGAKTLESARDQDGSRWFVLNGVLGGGMAPQESPAFSPAASVPVLEVFSLAGGVGKTSLVATLGRALSTRGERVLLVEATPFGSLPYFFGACDCRPGKLRTFRPPSSSNDAPIRLATIDSEAMLVETAVQGSLAAEIQGWARGASRVIVDVATRSTATAKGLARLSPVVLVPLVPDVNSVLTAKLIDSFFQHSVGAPGAQPTVYFVLNQFDPSLPLHLDLQRVLRDRLGERLLPFALQRSPAVSEALAEGMTIMDYAGDSPLAEDITNLAKWLEEVMAPAAANARNARWSEQ